MTAQTPRPLLLGLIGTSIQRSRTPAMHMREAAAQGVGCVYRLIDLTELGLGAEALPELLTAAERMGFVNRIMDRAELLPNATATAQALAQTINFGTLGDRVLGSGNFNLSASATSNLPVQFASLSVSVCSVSGATVTLVATGTCQISATQPGDTVYAAAPSVVRSFAITASGTAGGGDDGDVPLPDWAVVLLALCMLGAMHRRSRRAPATFSA